MFFHSFIATGYAFALFFTVNSPVNVAWSSCPRKVHLKGIKSKTFPQGFLISLSGVVVRCSRVEPKVPGSSPTQFFFPSFFFFPFFVLLFSINIYLNNCYLIKCNKQQEKYRASSEKTVHHILNIWINNLNFYHFLQFTVGKPELITTCRNDHFLNNVPTSSFYRLMVIILVLSNM